MGVSRMRILQEPKNMEREDEEDPAGPRNNDRVREEYRIEQIPTLKTTTPELYRLAHQPQISQKVSPARVIAE